MVKKIFNKIVMFIFGVFDETKEFAISLGIKILVVLLIGMVLHNVYKMSEISSRYKGQYKRLLPVYNEENKMMNIYDTGSGDKTLVILPGFGSQSPVIQYKTLIDGLKDRYRVVVIEYFGYGYSMSIKKERSNELIASEIKALLEFAEIPGPYVLVPHSISNIYAMYFEQAYPDSVDAIVSIDGLYPSQIEDEYYLANTRNTKSNINLTSLFEYTGFERLLSLISPSTFYIDKMKEMPDIFGDEELSIYKNRIGSSYLTRTMVREINKLEDNMNEMKDYKYPVNLPVLEILASETFNQYADVYESGNSEVDLEILATSVLSNPDIQTVKQINGDHMLQLTNPNELVNSIREFLERENSSKFTNFVPMDVEEDSGEYVEEF